LVHARAEVCQENRNVEVERGVLVTKLRIALPRTLAPHFNVHIVGAVLVDPGAQLSA
jgi:hypothetical protein